MTRQITDSFYHHGDYYDIVKVTDHVRFNPRDYGLKPHIGVTTATYNGYWCHFDLRDDGLYLDKLYIWTIDKKYPPLNGVEVSPVTYHEVLSHHMKDGEWVTEYVMTPDNFGFHDYKDVNLLVPYTGRLLVGSDFQEEFYDSNYIYEDFRSSSAWPFVYGKLKEFVYEEGRVVDCIDYSDISRELREQIDVDDANWKGQLDHMYDYIDDHFSAELQEKLWWL